MLSPEQKQVLTDFQIWVQQEGPRASSTTARRYAKYAESFASVYGNPLRVSSVKLREWLTDLLHRKPKPSASTVNVQIAALRALFSFLVATEKRPSNPATDVLEMQRVPKRNPKPISRADLDDIFTALKDASKQDLVMFEILYGSGLRRSETATLALANFIGRDKLQVIGKGDKERITILTERAYMAVRNLMLERGDERTHQLRSEISDDAAFDDLRKRQPELPIFLTDSGAPVSTLADPGHFVWQRCRPYFTKLGSGTPHRIRHSFGTHLLSGGVDPYTVMQVMGHSNIATTQGYMGIEDASLDRARKAHPRS